MMDKIVITGIRCYGYTGYFPEEKVLGQWFQVDLTLWLDLSLPCNNDQLTDTIDYGKVIELVQNFVKNSQFNLVEKLADSIAKSLLQNFPCQQVRISLTKLAPPLRDFNGNITIDITRKVE